ncbi:MAG: ASKHA domain-containing protein [Candidatus Bathyarchaeia archaeon]
MKVRVLVKPLNRMLEAEKGDILLQVRRDAGVGIESICGGKGKCGKCKVILERGSIEKVSEEPEMKLLTERELEQGYHLACMTRILSDSTFTIPVESRIEKPKILLEAELRIPKPNPSSGKYLARVQRVKSSLFPIEHYRLQLDGYRGPQPRITDEMYGRLRGMADLGIITATLTWTGGFPEVVNLKPGDDTGSNYGLALDVGTTTVVGELVELNSGRILARASEMNRQITYGEELVTRIAVAGEREGLIKLQKAVVETINIVIDRLASEAEIEPSEINDICVGGNTVMNHLLNGLDPTYLEEANVEVSRSPIIRKAGGIGLKVNPEAYLYCLPNVSRFLGGDAVGDVLASGMYDSDEISLLVDLGTNGEIIFGNNSWLFSSSCASGPAFEGGGIRHGMRGAEGGIERVRIDPETYRAEISVIGGTRPKGICGSGIIDLVASLYDVGLLDFVGKLVPGRTPLVREGPYGLEYVVVPADETAIGRDIVITQQDLDYIMDSKAAACGAITVLMRKLKLSIYDVKHLYLAGAFGNYADIENATRIGIFPELPNAEVHPIGNGSLAGAYAALMSMEMREKAREIAEKMVYIDLLVDVEFIEEYSNALYIPGNKEYFPSHTKRYHISGRI